MKKWLIPVTLLLTPAIASAQTLAPVRNLIASINALLNTLVPIAMTLALLAFFWGVIDYIRHPEFKNGKKIMIAGLGSLFVMVSVWGIIHLIQGALSINPGDKFETAPTVGGSGPGQYYGSSAPAAGPDAGSAQNYYDPRLYGQPQP